MISRSGMAITLPQNQASVTSLTTIVGLSNLENLIIKCWFNTCQSKRRIVTLKAYQYSWNLTVLYNLTWTCVALCKHFVFSFYFKVIGQVKMVSMVTVTVPQLGYEGFSWSKSLSCYNMLSAILGLTKWQFLNLMMSNLSELH